MSDKPKKKIKFRPDIQIDKINKDVEEKEARYVSK
jgi:hypothetical protein